MVKTFWLFIKIFKIKVVESLCPEGVFGVGYQKLAKVRKIGMVKFKNICILILLFVLMFSVYGIASQEQAKPVLKEQHKVSSQEQPKASDTKKQKIEKVWYNSPLAGVALASFFSLITIITNSWTASRQDKEKWEREQKALYEKQKYDDEKNQICAVKDIYHNCIGRLSIIAAISERDSEIEEENFLNLVREASVWLAKLSIIQRDSYDPSELGNVSL